MEDTPTYEISAIDDWKAGRISRDRLLEIFRINLFAGYGFLGLNDRTLPTSSIRERLSEAIVSTVMCELNVR